MKILLGFKTPDVVDYAMEDVPEDERDNVKEVIEKFVEYGEDLTVEIDTETGTAEVLPVRRRN